MFVLYQNLFQKDRSGSFARREFLHENNACMKCPWKLLFLFPLLTGLSLAQVGLRTAPSIVIEKGFPKSTNIIADDQGFVYLEMTEQVLVQKRDDGNARFDGEILPPTIIGPEERFYEQKPRGRTRSIVAFEIASDTLESLKFLDYFKQIPQRSRARIAANLENPADLEQRTRLIIPLFQEYNQPILWEYLGVDESESRYYKERWERIGGVKEETPEEDIYLFTVNISGTGVYVLFDEDPEPSEEDIFIPYEEIELAPEAPYQSVSPRAPTAPLNLNPEFTIDPTDPNQIIPYPNGEVNIPLYPGGPELPVENTNPLIIEPTPNFNVPPTINPLQVGTYNPNAVNTTFGIPNRPLTLNPNIPSSFAPPPLIIDSAPPLGNIPPSTESPEGTLNDLENPLLINQPSQPLPSEDQQKKVASLIQERLLQDNRSEAPSLEEREIQTQPPQAETLEPEASSISESLLTAEEKTPPRSIQEALKAQVLSEPTEEPEFYESAEKSLPKTGNKMIFGGILSFVLVLSFGLYWFYIRDKKPRQMTIKLKK